MNGDDEIKVAHELNSNRNSRKNDPDLFECAQDEIVDVRRCSSESLSWSIECNSGACFINTNERIWFELFS